MPVLPITPPNRTNATALLNAHPGDHNLIVDAINEVDDELNVALSRANYRIYDTVALRNADVTAHVEGMLSWAVSERQLCIWHGEWQVLLMPYTPFIPRCFIGDDELAAIGPPPGYQSGWRLSYGIVQFSIGHRFGQLAAPPTHEPTDIVYILPPILPDGQGGFGNAYVVDVTDVGAVGGMGGVYDALKLAIVMPADQGLLNRSHLGADGGEIDVFMNGFYTTATYALP